MTIVAKSLRGHEFMYNPRSAHAVAERKAKAICDELNKLKYLLNNDNEVWYVHEVDQYDIAPFEYAQDQRFTWGKRGLIRKFTHDWVRSAL